MQPASKRNGEHAHEVGTQSISPLLWAISSGGLEADNPLSDGVVVE